jgi:hypothetical protein
VSGLQGRDAHREWVMAVCHLRGALLAREGMSDPAASQDVRDQATDRYCRAVDSLVEHLNRLSEGRVLGRITDLLAEEARA